MLYQKLNGNLVSNDILKTGGVIVHGCNAQGAMGSGVAKIIRDTWPNAYTKYRETYDSLGLETGDVIFAKVQETDGLNDALYVANAVTQEFYRGHPKAKRETVFIDYDSVARCFEDIADFMGDVEFTVPNLHMPLIGAGLAGGDWARIEGIILETLKDTDINLYLWIYN
jgi:O-acetyl-ADP-ribose deacetylase (regulator of RNase III)